MKKNQQWLTGLVCLGLLMSLDVSGKDGILQKIRAQLEPETAGQSFVNQEKQNSLRHVSNIAKNRTSIQKLETSRRILDQVEKGAITGYVYEKSVSGAECETSGWYNSYDPHLGMPQLGGSVGDTLLVPVRVIYCNVPTTSFEMTLHLDNALIYDTLDTYQSLIEEAGWNIDVAVSDQQVMINASGADAIFTEDGNGSSQDTLFFISIIISETPFQFLSIDLSDVIFDTGTMEVELVHGGIYASPDSVVIIPFQDGAFIEAYNEFGALAGIGDTYDSGDGSYMIDDLLPGRYYLRIDEYPSGTVYYDQALSWQEADLIQVSSNQTATDINFILDNSEGPVNGGVITGKITDTSGTAITACRVYAYYGPYDFDYAGESSIDSLGVYTIKGLQSGEYRVLVRYDGPDNLLNSWYLDQESYEEAASVEVTEPDTTRDVNIVLQPGCVLSGRVLDAQGYPAGWGYKVIAYVSKSDDEKWTETNDEGVFELNGLPPGAYKIRIIDSFYREYPDIWYGDATCYEDADNILAELNNPVSNIIVQLREGGSVSGTVYRPDGNPVECVDGILELYNADGTYLNRTQTDDDGVYEISGLAAGTYKLYFESWASQISNFTGTWYGNTGDFGTALLFEVRYGEKTPDINIDLDWGGTISGHVFCPGEDPADLIGNVVAYNHNNNPVASGDLSGDTYKIYGLRPGAYKLLFNCYRDKNFCDIWYPNAGAFEDGDFITVQAKEVTESVDFTLEYAGRIQGFIKDVQGQHLSSDEYPLLNVTVIDANTCHYVDDFEISFNGGYDFLLPSGEYKLCCSNHYFNLYESDQDSLAFSFYSDGFHLSDPNTQVIAAQSNETLKLDDWVIEQVGGGVSGTLFDQETGLNITDFFYGIAAVNTDSVIVKLSAYLAQSGEYAVLGLQPGEYCLLAVKGTDLWSGKMTAQWYEATRAEYYNIDTEFYVPVPEGVAWVSVGDTVRKAMDIYFLEAIPSGNQENTAMIPESFRLNQNYPNPFNPVTNIQYALPVAAHVEIRIFNMLGQQVSSLIDKKQTAGVHRIQWDGSGFPSGLYFYRIQAGEFCDTKKCLLLK